MSLLVIPVPHHGVGLFGNIGSIDFLLSWQVKRGPEMWSQKMFTNDLSTLIKSVSIMSCAFSHEDCRGQDPVLLSRGLGKILWRKLVRDTFQDRTCLSHSQHFFRVSHSIASVRPALPYASGSCLSWRNCYPKKQIYSESSSYLLGTAGSSPCLSLSFSGFISLDLRQAQRKHLCMDINRVICMDRKKV